MLDLITFNVHLPRSSFHRLIRRCFGAKSVDGGRSARLVVHHAPPLVHLENRSEIAHPSPGLNLLTSAVHNPKAQVFPIHVPS
jgi:hypothetical protein